jgi:predicted XRE-type DNA-binding protein
MNDDEFEIVRGSGNLYADLADPDSDAKLMKARLAAEIISVLDERRHSAQEGEKLIGIAAADLSRIRNADLSHFTIDQMVRILNALDMHATIEISKMPKSDRTAA